MYIIDVTYKYSLNKLWEVDSLLERMNECILYTFFLTSLYQMNFISSRICLEFIFEVLSQSITSLFTEKTFCGTLAIPVVSQMTPDIVLADMI